MPIDVADAWDFEQVYGALHDIARNYAFDVERNQYFINITTGTHVVQICLYLLTEAHYLPGKLIQASPSKEGTKAATRLSIWISPAMIKSPRALPKKLKMLSPI